MKYLSDLTISSSICSEEEVIEIIHDRRILFRIVSTDLIFVEMPVIETDSDEKSCHTDDKPESSQCEIVEELVRCELIIGFYIHHTTCIESDFYESYDPEYRTMDSVDQYEK